MVFDSRLPGRGLTSLAASFGETHCSGPSQADSSPAGAAGAAGLDEVPVVVPAGIRQGDGSGGDCRGEARRSVHAMEVYGSAVSLQACPDGGRRLVPGLALAPRGPAAAQEPPRAAGQPMLGVRRAAVPVAVAAGQRSVKSFRPVIGYRQYSLPGGSACWRRVPAAEGARVRGRRRP